eukprot:gnl/Hemi2/11489_TR3969_c0_g1_i1.p1 gnl/Hemi2/11489_TR3969_c0_g1~~gnl/Hemi2/11489_TR3969_c0_g1_i1.p1  ORF type:complete len:140 (-),score=50.96 gnl/Hemi2/11489_TR3969_c0_g1_i1:124-543(-)
MESLEFCKTLAKIEEDLRVANTQVAKSNVKSGEEVDALKAQNAAAREAVAALRASWDQKFAQQQQITARFSPAALIERLGGMAQARDSASEALAEQFLEQKVAVKDFSKPFIDERTCYHRYIAMRDYLARTLPTQQKAL